MSSREIPSEENCFSTDGVPLRSNGMIAQMVLLNSLVFVDTAGLHVPIVNPFATDVVMVADSVEREVPPEVFEAPFDVLPYPGIAPPGEQ